MNRLALALLLPLTVLFWAHPASAFDESINFQPGLNLFSDVSQMTDLLGKNGSQLCAPVSITHGMQYLKETVGFHSLSPVKDLDSNRAPDTFKDRIRYFYGKCGTDKERGTHYHQTQTCMADYVRQSGYKPWVYIVGPHAINSPPSVPLSYMRHALMANDVRNYVKQRLMVIMAVGWYEFDPATKTYKRIGGHFFNVYGYNWEKAWGDSKLELVAVNSLQNYAASSAPFDLVQMTAVPADGTTYPSETKYVLTGPGFAFTQKTLVEDLFIVWPLAP